MTIEKKFLEVLQLIDISKAAGIDRISGIFVKGDANVLAKHIAKICNISISSGLFKLKPLHKRGTKADPEGFRPIFLLPLTSKVIKRIVYNQVDNLSLQNNTLYNYKSEFRKNHSTHLSLSFINDKKPKKVLIKDFSREWS